MIYFFHLLNSLGSSEDSDEHYPNIGKTDEQVFLVVCEHFFPLFSVSIQCNKVTSAAAMLDDY